MKKFILPALLLIAQFTSAQTVEEIMNKLTIALGGSDKFKAIKTAVIKGKITMAGMEFPFTMSIIAEKAVRMEMEAMGMKVIQVYNQGKGWTINPVEGKTTAQELSGDELESLKDLVSLADDLVDYKAKGYKVELLGSEKVEDVDTWKLKLIKTDSSSETYFLDKKSMLKIKTSTMEKEDGNEIETESFYSDFREMNGIKFPFNVIEKVGGEIIQEVAFESIELNIKMDEKIFDKPVK